jgi:hypothetical protein
MAQLPLFETDDQVDWSAILAAPCTHCCWCSEPLTTPEERDGMAHETCHEEMRSTCH